MKKLALLFAAATMAVSVSAQTVTESKTFDNFYIGINGGVMTKTTDVSWMKNLNPNFGLRIGRYFTPVFGLAVESNAYLSNKPGESTGTFIRSLNTSLLGTVNLSNWFGGYPGEPRSFEVTALYGLGWFHVFTNIPEVERANRMSSKAGVDFTFNFGSKKQFQFYIEPSITWLFLNGYKAIEEPYYEGYALDESQPKYDINNSFVQLNAGLVYKFGNSNGTHNFTICPGRDQAEIDALNATINDLRNALNGKDGQIADKDRKIRELQQQLNDCLNREPVIVKNETATNLQPTVLFRQGKSVIDPAQYAPIELIASYMKNHPEAKVEIRGYASPEGSAEINQRLSNERAEVVRQALIKKYKIAADRLTAVGMGATDKLFEQVEFNRVATFNDNTKK
jgi:outer membrane protein OmpA-like peptidoglycan-associated protein